MQAKSGCRGRVLEATHRRGTHAHARIVLCPSDGWWTARRLRRTCIHINLTCTKGKSPLRTTTRRARTEPRPLPCTTSLQRPPARIESPQAQSFPQGASSDGRFTHHQALSARSHSRMLRAPCHRATALLLRDGPAHPAGPGASVGSSFFLIVAMALSEGAMTLTRRQYKLSVHFRDAARTACLISTSSDPAPDDKVVVTKACFAAFPSTVPRWCTRSMHSMQRSSRRS